MSLWSDILNGIGNAINNPMRNKDEPTDGTAEGPPPEWLRRPEQTIKGKQKQINLPPEKQFYNMVIDLQSDASRGKALDALGIYSQENLAYLLSYWKKQDPAFARKAADLLDEYGVGTGHPSVIAGGKAATPKPAQPKAAPTTITPEIARQNGGYLNAMHNMWDQNNLIQPQEEWYRTETGAVDRKKFNKDYTEWQALKNKQQ